MITQTLPRENHAIQPNSKPNAAQQPVDNVIQFSDLKPLAIIDRPHTISSIAVDCEVSRDVVKYAHKKVVKESGELGEKALNGQWQFSNDEKAQIVAKGKLTDKSLFSSEELEHYEAEAVDVELCTSGSSLAKYRSGIELYKTSLPVVPSSNASIVESFILQAQIANTDAIRFDNLLNEKEIQESIQKGAERGAIKAALERSAENKAYQQAMTTPKLEVSTAG